MSYENYEDEYEPKLVARNCMTCFNMFYTFIPSQVQCNECRRIAEAEHAMDIAYEETGPQFPSF